MDRNVVMICLPTDTSYARAVLRGATRFACEQPDWSLGVRPLWDLRRGFHRIEVDGLLIQAMEPWHVEEALAANGSAVNVADAFAVKGLPTVISDHRKIGRAAAEHLLQRGLRHFAYYGNEQSLYSHERRVGFADALTSAGIELEDGWRYDDANDSVRLPRKGWLKKLPHPVGIMTAHDALARGVADGCISEGLRVPQDVAIIGVDNDEMACEVGGIPLSTVATDGEGIGYEAARLLGRLMAGQAIEQKLVLIPPLGVIARASTDLHLSAGQ